MRNEAEVRDAAAVFGAALNHPRERLAAAEEVAVWITACSILEWILAEDDPACFAGFLARTKAANEAKPEGKP